MLIADFDPNKLKNEVLKDTKLTDVQVLGATNFIDYLEKYHRDSKYEDKKAEENERKVREDIEEKIEEARRSNLTLPSYVLNVIADKETRDSLKKIEEKENSMKAKKSYGFSFKPIKLVVKSKMGLKELAAFTNVVSDELHNIHFLCKGDSFFRAHEFAEELYDKFNEFYDYLQEAVLMTSDSIIPLGKSKQYLSEDFIMSSGEEFYSGKEVYSKLKDICEQYLIRANEVCNNLNDEDYIDKGIKVKLEDFISEIGLLINYKLKSPLKR
jgi:DNA-binding ferritin-like protein